MRTGKNGRTKEASEKFSALSELINLLFVESNPIPIKHALFELGLMRNEFRPPLAPMDEELARKLTMEMKKLELAR